MAVIGIDFGTTNSLAAAFIDGRPVLIPNAFGEHVTPSAVSFLPNGSVAVGKVARERRATDPENTVVEFKRRIGGNEAFHAGGRSFLPEELSAYVLRQLAQDAERYLGEAVDEVVLSVPAYFDVTQRAATKRAAHLAGLHVERLVNEPSAAALAHRRPGCDDAFLVFDFGGGTLDISIVDCFDNVVAISAVSGDMHLGGADFDEAIAREACRVNGRDFDRLGDDAQALLLECEAAKRALVDDETEAFVHGRALGFSEPLRLTNEVLFGLSRDLLARIERPIRRVLADSDVDIEDISRVLMVGGSSHMPVVRHYLRSLLAVPVSIADECDTAVALGLGVYAGIRQRCDEARDLVLTDICPHSLSTDVMNHDRPELPRASFLIRRNTVLPASRSGWYQASDPAARAMTIRVFQGEGVYAQDNEELASFEVPLPRGGKQEAFRLTFTYDLNAMLGVEVAMQSTGDVARYAYTGSGWVRGENARTSLADIQASLRLDGRALEAAYLRERACRIAAECAPGQQEMIVDALGSFERVMEGNNLRLQRDAQAQLAGLLDYVEGVQIGSQQGFFRCDEACEEWDWINPESRIPDDVQEGDDA